MTDKLTFVRLCHLGTKEEQDQRLAVDQHGNYYLYDWSGSRPDMTDDGPCMINFARTVEVEPDRCYVPVVCAGSDCQVCVTLNGALKLFETLAARGTKPPAIRFGDKAAEIMRVYEGLKTFCDRMKLPNETCEDPGCYIQASHQVKAHDR